MTDRAAYMRQYRAKQGATTGVRGPKPTQPCGTVAAFRRHKRRGEEPCEHCKAAERERQARLFQERKARRSSE